MDTQQQHLLREVCAALGLEDSRQIGEGGQKVILQGTLGGEPAAGKVIFLSGNPANDQTTLLRARREVELLAAVDSPNVVHVLTDAIEVGEPVAAIAWAEEWLDGEDLTKSLGDEVSDEEVWKLIRDVAIALDACHSLDVVHRDLSPNNVRRKDDGTYVLMDPGLAKHLAKTALTGAFQPGTPGWRSPEHVLGGDPVPSSDIFCLGILAYVALTKKLPINPTLGQDEYDRILLEEQISPLSKKSIDVDPKLATIVDRCLQRQPARRFLDGAELLDELNQVGRGL